MITGKRNLFFTFSLSLFSPSSLPLSFFFLSSSFFLFLPSRAHTKKKYHHWTKLSVRAAVHLPFFSTAPHANRNPPNAALSALCVPCPSDAVTGYGWGLNASCLASAQVCTYEDDAFCQLPHSAQTLVKASLPLFLSFVALWRTNGVLIRYKGKTRYSKQQQHTFAEVKVGLPPMRCASQVLVEVSKKGCLRDRALAPHPP